MARGEYLIEERTSTNSALAPQVLKANTESAERFSPLHVMILSLVIIWTSAAWRGKVLSVELEQEMIETQQTED